MTIENATEQNTLNILIVDDSATDRTIFQRYLKQNKSASYSFQEAESINEALNIIESGKPDCVLLDYDLPDGSGMDLIEKINVDYGRNSIPIVILSGVESIEVALATTQRGAQDFLVKNRATTADLMRAVDNAIDKVRLYHEKEIATEKIRVSEEKYRQLFNSIDEGFCVIEVIFNDSQEAVDYRFLEINDAFEKQTGLAHARGELVSKLVPNLEKTWLETYGKVALTGIPMRVDNRVEDLNRWYDVYAFRFGDSEKNQVAIIFNDISERQQAEAKLRESEERYRTLFDSIDEGFCIVEMLFDAEGKPQDYRFLEMNPSFEKLTGLSIVEALRGKTARQLVPNLEEKWFEIYGRVAVTGEPVRFIEGSEAMQSWFDVYAFRVGTAESPRVAIIFNNITERKTTEINLRLAEERYRALVESTATTVWRANPEGALTYVGDSWTKVSGQSVEEILKWGWLEALHPDDREPTIAIWQKSLAEKSLYSTEFRILTVSGEYRWYAVSAVPIFDADGNLREWVGSNVDITSRKRAEEERTEAYRQLANEQARLTYIFQNAPAFVAVLRGAQHVYELTNPAYLRLIGHRHVIGKTVREALPDLVGQGYFELLDKVYQTGEPFVGRESPVELQHTPDSPLERRYVNFVFQPIFEADQSVSGIFVHGVDITEQVTARQTADNANRLKDEFLATLSHELRTPLNAILGWAQIARTKKLTEAELKNALNIIDRSARSQKQLIEDILDVSRIITGKFRLDVRAIDLVKVITAAIESARPAAEAKNIRLQMLLDPQATNISGDSDRLQQVIWNLLSNAVKFTPKNGRIQVRLERVNSHVEITVSDTGKGIEPEFLPFIFDRFRQFDGSMTRRQGGLGLGLAIVRQIIELHGGVVSVNSLGKDQGAAFSIRLPLLPLRLEPDGEVPRIHPEATDAAAIGEEIKADLSGLKILVVDDETDSRDLLQLALESYSAAIVPANSAAKALAEIENEKFDLIISDIGMPEEDGFSLIGKIRKLPAEQGGKTPAIALTAYARAEDRIKALQSGFQMHVSKPINLNELIAVIVNLTEMKIN